MRNIIKMPQFTGNSWRLISYAIFGDTVVFFHVANMREVWWKARIDDKVYGDWITVEDEQSIEEAIEILYDQAEDVITNLKDKSPYERDH